MKNFLIALTLLLLPAGVHAQDGKKQVISTIESIEAVAREVGGDDFVYESLARPDEDPHFVSPTPKLWVKVQGADAFLEVGMWLEPWADLVTNKSGNPRIFRGNDGWFDLSLKIPKEEVPSEISRSQGDLHPDGNPHYWLDPLRAGMMADAIAVALKKVDPSKSEAVDARLKKFKEKIAERMFGKELLGIFKGPRLLTNASFDGKLHAFLEKDYKGKKLSEYAGGWLKKAASLRGVKVVEYHKVWVYFTKTFGMELLGTIEEKPGIAPGPRHQQAIIDLIKREGVDLILVDNFYDAALPRKIAEATGARVVILPSQVGGEKGVDTYFELIDHILDKMLEAVRSND